MGRIVVITGGSSGIGRAAAAAFLRRGDRVYTLSRRPETAPGAVHITADVTDEAALRAAIAQVIALEGRVDVLISNAGFGISGPVETTDIAQAKALLDVNVLGLARCVRAAGEALRQSGGYLLAVSSVAAPISIPFQAWYSASKAAINSLIAALRNELRPWGVRVSAVMPGDVHTGFTAAREKDTGGGIYGQAPARAVAVMEADEAKGLPPEAVAATLLRVSLKKHPAPFYTVGGKYKLFVLLSRFLPGRWVCAIVGRLYR